MEPQRVARTGRPEHPTHIRSFYVTTKTRNRTNRSKARRELKDTRKQVHRRNVEQRGLKHDATLLRELADDAELAEGFSASLDEWREVAMTLWLLGGALSTPDCHCHLTAEDDRFSNDIHALANNLWDLAAKDQAQFDADLVRRVGDDMHDLFESLAKEARADATTATAWTTPEVAHVH